MNQEEKFLSYLNNLSNKSNKAIVESIIQGFKILSNYKPLNENSDDIQVNTGDAEDANSSIGDPQPEATIPEPDMAITEADEEKINNLESKEDEVVASEVIAPELLEKVKKLCTEVLGLYKHMTGAEFIKEDEPKEGEASAEESKESGDVNGDDSIPAPMLEEINLATRTATNDHTGTDYSNAFQEVFANIDSIQSNMVNVYRTNNIDPQDQIVAQLVPKLDEILELYKEEIELLEAKHMDDIIPVVKNTIANSVNSWISILRRLDVMINKDHELHDYNGRVVIEKFIDDVANPALNYFEIINDLYHDDNMYVNIKGVMKKIDALINKFNANVNADIKEKSGGRAYTRGIKQPSEQTV